LDKADDEELSQDHICLPSTRFEEQLFLDDLPMSDAQGAISHSLMDSHSQNTTSPSVGMELDHIDDLLLVDDNLLDSDCERGDQGCAGQSGLPPLQVKLNGQWDHDISSTIINFSDSDSAYDLPFTYHMQSRHWHANLHTATESVPQCVAHDHASAHERISQGSLKPPLRLEQRSKLSNSSHSPSTSLHYQDSPSGTSQETEVLSEKSQLTCWGDMCEKGLHQVAGCTTQFPDLYGLSDDDPNELLPYNPDSSCFNGVNIDHDEDFYGLEEFEGAHLGYDLDASQHPSTLLVTCPHRKRDVEEENGEPAKLINVECLAGVLDGAREEWEEDGMFVVDF
jgi:hypothetical protein